MEIINNIVLWVVSLFITVFFLAHLKMIIPDTEKITKVDFREDEVVFDLFIMSFFGIFVWVLGAAWIAWWLSKAWSFMLSEILFYLILFTGTIFFVSFSLVHLFDFSTGKNKWDWKYWSLKDKITFVFKEHIIPLFKQNSQNLLVNGDITMIKSELQKIEEKAFSSGEDAVSIMERKVGFLIEQSGNPLESRNMLEHYRYKKNTMRTAERLEELKKVLNCTIGFVKAATDYNKTLREFIDSEEMSRLESDLKKAQLKADLAEFEAKEKLTRATLDADIAEQNKRKKEAEKKPPKPPKQRSKKQGRKEIENEILRLQKQCDEYEKELREKGVPEEDIPYKRDVFERRIGLLDLLNK